ncbi:WYL domain-containing protein [Sphingomonas sp. RP10(2022)]|uniref:WYL domain-containing protein n=1 Tax=Sphingomonas liriopis TaxID=2949094 RepID=A0A9X2HVY9_9SPHN|nr:WYL domain-containing protein [Sphingomonas liriopis]MCP3736514.1 WYL domain-containing protein [Sphingomonas liriopis]
MTQSSTETAMPTGPVPTMFEAIVRQRAVTATYNKGTVVMAPHILYTRHGEIYVDAITVERDGKPPREEKLGTFKLDGLGQPTLTETPFRPSALFEPEAEKYVDVTLMAVERG